MDCVFCKIVSGAIPSEQIYTDDDAVAFLDIEPVTSGHTLLIPKMHYTSMVATPDELVARLFTTAKALMPKIQVATGCDYVVLAVVGTDVPHFHIHLTPRKFNDGLAGFWPTKTYADGEATLIAEQLRKHI